jgi:membrane protein DedA with SNARE-associated domain
MAIETFIARYGLAAIFLGAGIEGETSVIAGGVLAHRHLLPLSGAIIAAALGSCIADQLFFAAGRYFREHRRVRAMAAKPAFAKALVTFEHHPTLFVIGFRFLYGLRTVSPAAIGTSHILTRKFVLLNALSAAIWGVLFTGLGYGFGGGIERLFGGVSAARLIPIGVAGLVLLIGIAQLVRRLHHRYADRCESRAARVAVS